MPESNQYVLDRVTEGVSAHLENSAGHQITIPPAWLPTKAKEGDVFDATHSGEGNTRTVTLSVNEAATRERREQMGDLRSNLPKGPEGDMSL